MVFELRICSLSFLSGVAEGSKMLGAEISKSPHQKTKLIAEIGIFWHQNLSYFSAAPPVLGLRKCTNLTGNL